VGERREEGIERKRGTGREETGTEETG